MKRAEIEREARCVAEEQRIAFARFLHQGDWIRNPTAAEVKAFPAAINSATHIAKAYASARHRLFRLIDDRAQYPSAVKP